MTELEIAPTRRLRGLGDLLEDLGPALGKPEDDRIRQEPAEDILGLLPANLVGLGSRDVLPEAERLVEDRAADSGA